MPAAVGALQNRFGGAMGNAAGSIDTQASNAFANLRRLAMQATEGLFGSIKDGLARLNEQFENWHGLLRTPTDWAPIAHSAWVCALYAVPSLLAGYLVFLRRDVAGG